MNRQWSLVIALLLAFVSTTSVFAQTAAQSDIDQLKSQIEVLKQQQAASQQMIQALESKIDALQKAQPTEAPPQAQAAAHQRPAIAAPVSERAPALQSRDLFSEDRIAAPRIDNVPLDPDMAGFFRLGDSPTVMRLSGYGKLDVIHDFKLPGNPDLFIPSAFPLQPAPAGNNTSVNFRQSRLDLEIRRPTPVGDLRILYENDFFGAGPTVFHLRHLYGQLDNVLVGYTFTTFMDVDSLPDTLDFENPNSRVYMHQAQFRYTLPLSKTNSLAFSVEKPISDINVTNPTYPNIQATATTPIPDFVVRYRYETGKGHLQLGSVLRSVGGFASPATEGIFVTKHVFGWGVNLSGALRTYGKDSLLFQGAYGNGIARYFQDLTGLGADAALNSSNQLVATPVFGTFVAYQHYWNSKWRSTGTYGFVNLQNEASQVDTFFHKSHYSAFNLIWNPAGHFNVGGEYLYGKLDARNADRGYGSRVQLSMQYDFYKWTGD